MESKDEAKLISVKSALAHIGVSREFFYRQIAKGNLPSYKIGKKILVNLSEILAAMKQGGK